MQAYSTCQYRTVSMRVCWSGDVSCQQVRHFLARSYFVHEIKTFCNPGLCAPSPGSTVLLRWAGVAASVIFFDAFLKLCKLKNRM